MVHTLAVVNAVRKYPCLWNKTDADYKNVQLRKKAWLEICRSIYRDLENISANSDLLLRKMTIVQRKWRSSRDYFVKRQKTKNNFKQYSCSKYLRALSFLSPTSTSINTKIEADGDLDSESIAENDDDSQYFNNEGENCEDEGTVNEGNEEPVAQITIEDPVLISASNYSEYGHGKPFDAVEDFDVNRSFAMTIMKEMNGMTEQQNFQFRMEVMKALNTVKYKLPEYLKSNED